MLHNPIGKSSLTLSAIGLGCATFGREIDEATSIDLLDYALDKGIQFLDTAEIYGGGNAQAYRRENLKVDDVREVSGEMHSSELILGRWLKSRGVRDQVTLCTKVSTGNSPENIARAVQDSLNRLQVDAIDLYMVHLYDPKVPFPEVLEALNREIEAGRVKTLGCSNHTADQVRECLKICRDRGWARFEAIENIYNLVHAEVETDLLPLCREEDLSFIGYSPLGAGFLTGKYTPDRNQLPAGTRFDVIPGHCDVYFSEEGFRLVEKLKAMSEETGYSMAYLAGTWANRNPAITCMLFGARKRSHIDNALACLEQAQKEDLFQDW